MLRHCHGVHSREVLRAVQGYHVVLGPQRCWTAPGQRGYLSVTMSVLASRFDRASPTHRANRSANLRLLEELAEQLAQSRRVLASAMWPATRDIALWPCHSGGGEGHERLRRVPHVTTKGLVANRGKLTREGRTADTFMGRLRRLNSSAAHGDRLDCEQLDSELLPNGDGRLSSKASLLSADDVRPLSCDQNWIDPGGACIRG